MLKVESFDSDYTDEEFKAESIPMQNENGQNLEKTDGDSKTSSNGLDETALRRRAAESIYGSEEEVSGVDEASWLKLQEESEYYTVTKMNPGVRDQNRVNIFLDGHYVFSLDITQVVEFDVKVGQKISPERLTELRKASEFGKLYQRTLEWAMTRPHSVRETKNYLRRRQLKRKQLNRQRARDEKKPLAEIDDEVAELVINRLIEKKFLNDQKFAEYYVENRYLRKGISHKRLRMELIQKGVKDDIIADAMEKIPRDEDDEIRKVIAKKRKKYDDFQLVGYLVRQGFNFQRAKDAVAEYDPDNDPRSVLP